MWGQLTYSKKVYAITIGFVVFFVLAYFFSFNKTIQLYSDTTEKITKLEWLKEKEKEIPVLQAQMELLNKAYNSNDSSLIRDQLTSYISDFAESNNCVVTEIPEKSLYSNSSINVQTNKFVVKGDYNQLLTLFFNLEKEFNFRAKIVSAKFFSHKDMQTKKTNLYLTIIMQTFRQYEK